MNVIAIGGCHSAGAVILVSATGKRLAAPNALVSIHADVSGPDGDYSLAPRSRKRVEELLRSKASLPNSWFPLEGETAYYLTAQEALEFGVIDAIYTGEIAGGLGAR